MLHMLFSAYLHLRHDQLQTLQNVISEKLYNNNSNKEKHILCLPDRYLMHIFRKYNRAIYNVCTLLHLVNAVTQFHTSDGENGDE